MMSYRNFLLLVALTFASSYLIAQTLHNPQVQSASFYVDSVDAQFTGAVGNTSAILYGDNANGFHQKQFAPEQSLNYNHSQFLGDCISYDFNEDGIEDLVAFSEKHQGFVWYENMGDGNTSAPVFIQAADWQPEHSFEIRELEPGTKYWVMFNASSRRLSRMVLSTNENNKIIEEPLATGLYEFTWQDVDNDGRQDLVYSRKNDDKIHYKLNLPNGFSDEFILANVKGLVSFSFEEWNWESGNASTNQLLFIADEPARFGSFSMSAVSGVFELDKEVPVLNEVVDVAGSVSRNSHYIRTAIEPLSNELQCFIFAKGDLFKYVREESNFEVVFEDYISWNARIPEKGLIDLNDDGYLDLLVNHPSSFFPSSTSWIIYSTQDEGELAYLKDINGGLHVVQEVVPNVNRLVSFKEDLLGYYDIPDPDSDFDLVEAYPSYPRASSLELADFNNDGLKDVLYKDLETDAYFILAKSENGTFESHALPDDLALTYARLLDVNADNLVDFVIFDGEDIIYYENLGGFNFTNTAAILYTTPEGAFSDILTIDFDADGLDDILVATNSTVVILKRDGNSYVPSTLLPDKSSIKKILVTDLNLDGVLDLVLNVANSLEIYIYQENGKILSSSKRQLTHGLLIGVINQGDSDYPLLLVAKSSANANYQLAYLENNQGILGQEKEISINLKASSVSIVDFNSDGYDELSGTNLGKFQRLLLFPEGPVNTDFIEGASTYIDEIGSMQVNDDDKEDLVYLNSNDNVIYFKENTPDLPKAKIGLPLGNCFDQHFINLSEAYFPESTVHWDFGDGNTTNETHPNYTYGQAGIYDIELSVCNEVGCDTTYAQYEQKNIIALDVPEEASINELVTFANNSEGITDASWLFGEGTISTEFSPTHSYSLARPYTFEVYLTNNEVVDCTYYFAQDILILGDGSGVDELSCEPKVYPNPSIGQIHIDNCSEQIKGLQIINANGQVLKRYAELDQSLDIDLSGFKSGLYLLQWTDEKGEPLGTRRVLLK